MLKRLLPLLALAPQLALASAASFLGIAGLISLYGYDGFMYSVGFLMAYITVLLVIASLVLVTLVWAPYGFSLPGFLKSVVSDPKVQAQVTKLLGDAAANMTPAELGQRFLEPGLYLKDPLDQISLGLALVLGTAGLPHILMRFFTVPTAQEARKSVIWVMGIIGGFYVLTLFLGMGSAIHVGAGDIALIDQGGNMAAPLLAQYLGGGADSMLGNLFLAFVAAVAFATIVAVVAGLVLAAASAMAHDIYVGVIREGHATSAELVKAARFATVLVGAMAIVIGIAAKGQNVAHLVGLAFAVAASANLPCIVLTLYWRRCNTGGIIAGMVVGTATAIGLVLVSPNMTYPLKVQADATKLIAEAPARQAALQEKLTGADTVEAQKKVQRLVAKLEKEVRKAEEDLRKTAGKTTSLVGLEKPLLPLKNPGIISIPLGFLAVFLGSLLWRRDERADERWEELYVRQNTGIGAAKAHEH